MLTLPLDLGRPPAGAKVPMANAILRRPRGRGAARSSCVLDDFGGARNVLPDAVHPTSAGMVEIADAAPRAPSAAAGGGHPELAEARGPTSREGPLPRLVRKATGGVTGGGGSWSAGDTVTSVVKRRRHHARRLPRRRRRRSTRETAQLGAGVCRIHSARRRRWRIGAERASSGSRCVLIAHAGIEIGDGAVLADEVVLDRLRTIARGRRRRPTRLQPLRGGSPRIRRPRRSHRRGRGAAAGARAWRGGAVVQWHARSGRDERGCPAASSRSRWPRTWPAHAEQDEDPRDRTSGAVGPRRRAARCRPRADRRGPGRAREAGRRAHPDRAPVQPAATPPSAWHAWVADMEGRTRSRAGRSPPVRSCSRCRSTRAGDPARPADPRGAPIQHATPARRAAGSRSIARCGMAGADVWHSSAPRRAPLRTDDGRPARRPVARPRARPRPGGGRPGDAA